MYLTVTSKRQPRLAVHEQLYQTASPLSDVVYVLRFFVVVFKSFLTTSWPPRHLRVGLFTLAHKNRNAKSWICSNSAASADINEVVAEPSAASSLSSSELSEAEAAAAKTKSLGLIASAVVSPHPAKVKKGGEDAFFFRSSLDGGAIGVADGVGGYSEYGIDPGMFSRTLMQQLSQSEAKQTQVNPASALREAQEATRLPGASTAVVLQLNGTSREATYANVGDSGIRVLRDGKIVYASRPLMHGFNCPYQLAYTRLSPNAQTIKDADIETIPVLPGDIIVAATDGVFDNLIMTMIHQNSLWINARRFDSDIEEIISDEESAAGSSDLELVKSTAKALADEAFARSMDARYMSPFAQAKGEQQGGFVFQKPIGGKPDDITVVVALAKEGGVAGAESEVLRSQKEWEQAQLVVQKLLEGSEDVVRATQEALSAAESAGMVASARPAASGPRPKKKPSSGMQVFVESQVAAMDKAQLQRTLGQLGLPTSGKLSSLRQRLLDYRE
eukprot:jgi/Bigna1/86085/estExt_fgenesh1_pg.C_80050